MHKFGIFYLFQFSRSHLYLVMTFNHTFLDYSFNRIILLTDYPFNNSSLTYKKPSSDNSFEQPLEGLYYPRMPDLRIRRTANVKTATLIRARMDFAFKRFAMRAPAWAPKMAPILVGIAILNTM